MTGIRRLVASTLASAAVAAAWLSAGALAQTLCSAPVAPICVEVGTTYADESTAERCHQDLLDFTDEVKAYRTCLERHMAELESQLEQLQDGFACRREGKTDCPQAPTIPGE